MTMVAHPKYTNWTQGFKDTLDYIFYEPRHFQVVELGRLLSEDRLNELKIEKLPNSRVAQASDHLAISVLLEWKGNL